MSARIACLSVTRYVHRGFLHAVHGQSQEICTGMFAGEREGYDVLLCFNASRNGELWTEGESTHRSTGYKGRVVLRTGTCHSRGLH